MDRKDLRYYGPFRHKHEGKGTICLASGQRIEAKFLIAQRADASLLAFGRMTRFNFADLRDFEEISEVSGVLTDGRPFRLERNLFFSRFAPRFIPRGLATILIFPGYCEIGDRTRLKNGHASFGVENFLFFGTRVQTLQIGSREVTHRGILPLDLDGRQVTVDQLPEYERAVIELRASKRAMTTCTINVTLDDRSDVADLEAIADVLTDAMSVARGTLITWSSYEAKDSETHEHLTVYRAALTKTYNGNHPIPPDQEEDTKRLLERGYNSIYRRNPLAMRKAIRAYCETRQGPFVETKALMVGVPVEYLSFLYNKPSYSDFYLDSEQFSSAVNDISAELLSGLEKHFASAKRKDLKKLSARVGELNHKPFSSKAKNLFEALGLNVTTDDIRLLEKVRNSLAHSMDFPDPTQRTPNYLKLLHLIDRIFLRLLDYRGSYINLDTNTTDVL